MSNLLEAIPDEIYATIASMIRGSRYAQRTVLAFAGGSEGRRRDVVNAFKNHLVLHDHESDIFTGLITLFGDKLYELDLTQIIDQGLLANIPHRPSLRQAKMIASQEQLRIIRGCSLLSKIIVFAYPDTNWEAMIGTFASLPSFRYLQLHLHENLSAPAAVTLRDLAAACGSVEHFHIRGKYDVFHSYWPMIIELRTLKCISLRGDLRADQINFLRSRIRDVRLMGRTPVRQALQIGRRVTMITQGCPAAKEVIQRLNSCPHLRIIHTALKNGAEVGLWGRLGKVESLSLWWGVPDIFYPPAWNRRCNYYRPDGSFLIRLIKHAPKLRRLGLVGAIIRSVDISKILQLVNDRLIRLEVNLDNQDERKPRRLAVILMSLFLFCPNIKELILLGMGPEVIAQDMEIWKCLCALSHVRRQCPNLDTTRILMYIHRFRRVPMKRTWEEIIDQ